MYVRRDGETDDRSVPSLRRGKANARRRRARTSNASDDDGDGDDDDGEHRRDDASFFISRIGEKDERGANERGFVGLASSWIGTTTGERREDDSNGGDANGATPRVVGGVAVVSGGGGDSERDAAEWARGRRGGDAGGRGESTTESESKSKSKSKPVRGVERESGSRNAAVTAAGTTDDERDDGNAGSGSGVPNAGAERTRRGWDWWGDSRGDRRGVSPDATLGNEVGRRARRSGNVGGGEEVRVSDDYVALHF